MLPSFFCFTSLLLGFVRVAAQDTFSIVAVDTATGEIGSAGATCLDLSNSTSGALIISDVLPGRGAIHTQAYWNGANQTNARTRMQAGDAPQGVIDWLIANDAGGFGLNTSYRQYGIVDLDSSGAARVAAFTGVNTDDYKGHITGPNYAIQGNILLGPQILDSMEARFLNTPGTLADKLMAAMQGANVPGADTRCLDEGVSSLSAFMRVARPHDLPDAYYLDLKVLQTPFGVEPIDSLQALYDAWSPPVCDFTIPAEAVIISENQVTTDSENIYWVCAGDTLTLTGHSNTVYLEPGAALQAGAGAWFTTVYVREGAVFNGFIAIFNTLYIEPGSVIENPGPGFSGISCDSIRFDYSVAPLGGCNALTGVNHSDFAPDQWQIFSDLRRGEISVIYRGKRPVWAAIDLLDVSGRRLASWAAAPFTPGERLPFMLSEIAEGLYFVRIQAEQGHWTGRVLLRDR